jgi:hypothetical protein
MGVAICAEEEHASAAALRSTRRAQLNPAQIGTQEPLLQLPQSLQMFLDAERFQLHDVASYQDTSLDPSFDTRYLPQNCGAFELPCFWVQRKHLYVHGRAEREWQRSCALDPSGRSERILFPIHPISLPGYRQFLADVAAQDAAADGLTIWAVPTSSVRTLLVWPDGAPQKARFVKTSLHSPAFGDRILSRRVVARSVGLSELVEQSANQLPDGLDYFLEQAGFVPRHSGSGGVILRTVPGEIKDNRTIVVPLFSLFGGDASRPLLLRRVLDACGLEPARFVEEAICAPFARLWVQMTFRHGLLLESHAQDLLLALTPTLVPLNRFYYRDFEGMQLDFDLRNERNSRSDRAMPCSHRWYETYGSYGYRYSQLVSYKLHATFFNFVDWVVRPFGAAMRQWWQRGVLACPPPEESDLVQVFVRHVQNAIAEEFGVTLQRDYDILQSRNRFVLSLLRCRQALMDARRTSSRAWSCRAESNRGEHAIR